MLNLTRKPNLRKQPEERSRDRPEAPTVAVESESGDAEGASAVSVPTVAAPAPVPSELDFGKRMKEARAAGNTAEVVAVMYDRFAHWNNILAENNHFQNFVTLIICVASVLVGLQTYKSMEDNAVLAQMDVVILYIFTVEVFVKIFAEGRDPHRYFLDGWNEFDFLVVFVCYLPLDASMVTVLRLFRLLRVLKLVKALPELQVLVMGLLNSMSSIFYVALLLMLVFYLYAVLCISMFRENDPVHFPNLETTFLTLFRMATFEDWTDVMYIQMYGCDEYGYGFRQYMCTDPQGYGWFPAVFFITFVVLSSFVVLNLFIGVITSNMQDARDSLKRESLEVTEEEATAQSSDEKRCGAVSTRITSLIDHVEILSSELSNLQGDLDAISSRFKSVRLQKSEQDKAATSAAPGGGATGAKKWLSGSTPQTSVEEA
mmetsp:Transcript_1467/g.5423  ORF Transcript_1467/g.5423 Transcript_1467/m.5423 type:complete len:430 (+) Transcript_1467:271-1560(+)